MAKKRVATSNHWKSWCTAKIICLSKFQKKLYHFKLKYWNFQQARARTLNLGVRCKKWCNWTSVVGSWIRLLVVLGIRLHPKTSDSATLATTSCTRMVLSCKLVMIFHLQNRNFRKQCWHISGRWWTTQQKGWLMPWLNVYTENVRLRILLPARRTAATFVSRRLFRLISWAHREFAASLTPV